MIIAPLSRRGFTWSKSIIEVIPFGDVGQGGLDDLDHLLPCPAEHMLRFEQIALADGCSTQALHGADPVVQFFFLADLLFVGQIEHPAHDNAEHVDLVVEVAHEDGIQIGDLLGSELAGIKAMFDGIGIAWLGAAGALGGWLSLFRLESLLLILGHDCCSLYEFIQPACEG